MCQDMCRWPLRAKGHHQLQGNHDTMLNTALVLTFCICKAQSWSVEAAGLPGPCGQTDGPVPARAWPALRLGKRDICIWRLVKYLEFRKSTSKHHQSKYSVAWLLIGNTKLILYKKFVRKQPNNDQPY